MPCVKICTGRACAQHSSVYLVDRAKAELAAKPEVTVETCGCLGQCKKGPNIAIEHKKNKTIHNAVSGPKLAQILKSLFKL